LFPYLILRAEKSVKVVQWLSAVVCCYGLGIFIGNVALNFWSTSTAKSVSEFSVLLALPLLLFSTDIPAWLKLAKTTIISFIFVVLSVMLIAFSAGKIFSDADPEVWKMAGMMVGVYTGGTPNLMAIGKALEVRDDVFVMLNAVDVILGGFYLLIIMSFGVKLLGKFLPAFDHESKVHGDAELINWKGLTLRKKVKNGFILTVLALISVLLAVGLSRVITGTESVSVIMLGLTTISVGLSFFGPIRKLQGSQEMGQYLLLVFCIAVGSLANFSAVTINSLWYILFCAFILFGSILLHFLCCFFLKIDRDTAIITSMAGIFGPAFVAPMSQVLRNQAILFSGVTTGLVGYAIGNFAGIFIAYLLKG
jgi:uncharacterized membrane protein